MTELDERADRIRRESFARSGQTRIPSWLDLEESERDAWRRAAGKKAARRRFLDELDALAKESAGALHDELGLDPSTMVEFDRRPRDGGDG